MRPGSGFREDCALPDVAHIAAISAFGPKQTF